MPGQTGYSFFLENALKYGWMVPQGVIMMWSGLIANIPTGYNLCNGSNSTPDLRDKFVVGARQDDGGVAKTNVTGSLTQSGGALGHVHTFTGDGHVHGLDGSIELSLGSGNYAWDANFPDTATGFAGGTTDNKDELPPYYALAFIMKT